MDFSEAKQSAAREIALSIGVPPMLLGIPGDNTYSNYQEAQRHFWRATVLPLVNRVATALSEWLSPAWQATLQLRPDLDAIEALSPERDALWKRLEAASFISTAEKRAAAGYDTEPLDALSAKYNPNHGDRGRFTTGDGGNEDESDGPDNPDEDEQDDDQQDDEPKVEQVADKPGGKDQYGKTPRGRSYTKHGKDQQDLCGFTDKNIDDIVDNNKRVSDGIDDQGRKTWRHTDSRGNTVILNEQGGIVTVYSNRPGSAYIPKP
jgi:Phage portal protein